MLREQGGYWSLAAYNTCAGLSQAEKIVAGSSVRYGNCATT